METLPSVKIYIQKMADGQRSEKTLFFVRQKNNEIQENSKVSESQKLRGT